jgi:uncharacterized membrane protein
MKKLIIAGFIISNSLFLLTTQSAHAQMGSMMDLDNDETEIRTDESHAQSVEAVLQDILGQQNVSTVQQLDLAKISDDQWERLGDAVMELQHPGQAHEIMDQMMGGEGSESLSQMHINMGKAYLGYGSSFGPGMMGGNLMGNWNNNSLRGGGNYMMGSFSTNPMGTFGWGFGWIFMILLWGLIILGIVALVKWIANQGKYQTQDRSALDILKDRYAKGEIDKKEFEEKKKDLN